MALEPHARHSGLDDFVAALTEAAYPVALRHNASQQWLELELELWQAMAQTVQKWQQRVALPRA
jgi:hypothetical protein